MRSNDAFLGLPHDIFAFTMMQEIRPSRKFLTRDGLRFIDTLQGPTASPSGCPRDAIMAPAFSPVGCVAADVNGRNRQEGSQFPGDGRIPQVLTDVRGPPFTQRRAYYSPELPGAINYRSFSRSRGRADRRIRSHRLGARRPGRERYQGAGERCQRATHPPSPPRAP